MDYSLLIGVVRRHFEVKHRTSSSSTRIPTFAYLPGDGNGDGDVVDSVDGVDGVDLGERPTIAVNMSSSPPNGIITSSSIRQRDSLLSQMSGTRGADSTPQQPASVSRSYAGSASGGGGGGGYDNHMGEEDDRGPRLQRNSQESDISSSARSWNPSVIGADGGVQAGTVDAPGTYYIGIIDVLQEWNFKKRLERFVKTNILRYDADGISAMPPDDYRSRFLEFAVDDVFDGLSDGIVEGGTSNKARTSVVTRSSILRTSIAGDEARGSVSGRSSFMKASDPSRSELKILRSSLAQGEGREGE